MFVCWPTRVHLVQFSLHWHAAASAGVPRPREVSRAIPIGGIADKDLRPSSTPARISKPGARPPLPENRMPILDSERWTPRLGLPQPRRRSCDMRLKTWHNVLIIVGALIATAAVPTGALADDITVKASLMAALMRNYLLTLDAPAGTTTTESNPAYKVPRAPPLETGRVTTEQSPQSVSRRSARSIQKMLEG